MIFGAKNDLLWNPNDALPMHASDTRLGKLDSGCVECCVGHWKTSNHIYHYLMNTTLLTPLLWEIICSICLPVKINGRWSVCIYQARLCSRQGDTTWYCMNLVFISIDQIGQSTRDNFKCHNSATLTKCDSGIFHFHWYISKPRY